MRTNRIIAVVAVVLGLALPATAAAQGDFTVEEDSGFGVGIQGMLEGPNGASLSYDSGLWHVDVIAGLAGNGDTDVGFGGRFWYAVHSTGMSDLSVGAGIGIINTDAGPDDETTYASIEAGAKIRAFVANNVALSAALGLAVVTGDADRFSFGGQLTGSAGLTYYFW